MTAANRDLSGKVLVTGTSVSDNTLDVLSKRGLRVHNPSHLLEKDELAKELSDSVGYLLGGDEHADADVLRSAKQLKVIAFLGMGYENYVDAVAADDNGIVVTNTPNTLTDSCAEYAVAQLLNGRRKIVAYGAERRRNDGFEPSNQSQLSGHTYGVVGLGSIGTRVAEILTQAFRCPVVYWSRNRKPHIEERLGIVYKTLNEVASLSDGVVVATVGTPETRGLISQEVVGRMKAGTVLVNVARADVVDQGALCTGLRSGRIEVATFDPIYADPTVAATLFDEFDESKLIATPHIASLTVDAREAMGQKAAQSIISVLETGDDEYNVAR